MEADKSMPNGEIILYQPDSSIRLEVRMEEDTVWLNRQQMARLFDRDVKTIGKHINNALKEELSDYPVVAKFATTASDGKTYQVDYYNLDVILSVGYRVKSKRGIEFRRWANSILKEYLLRGYTINQHLQQMEQRIDGMLQEHSIQIHSLQDKVDFFVRTALPPVEGVFFDGQIFDAYVFAAGLIRSVPPSKTWGRSCSRSAGWGFLLTRCCREATEAVSVACLRHAVPRNVPYPTLRLSPCVGLLGWRASGTRATTYRHLITNIGSSAHEHRFVGA